MIVRYAFEAAIKTGEELTDQRVAATSGSHETSRVTSTISASKRRRLPTTPASR